MRAVILARGLGSRMKQDAGATDLSGSQAAAAAAGSKGMMPIGARPFLDYVLSAAADAGCIEVCLVVAPDHDAIRAYYDGPGRPCRVKLSYAVQAIANGTARAVLSARAFAGREPFLALNSDNLYPAAVLASLVELTEPGLAGFRRDDLVRESGFPSERVNAFAAVEVDEPGYLKRIIEKPGADYYERAGARALVSMNVWRFDGSVFDACRDVALSTRGEYELPEAVGLAVTRGQKFRVVPASGAVLDLSRASDVALVSGRLAGREPRP